MKHLGGPWLLALLLGLWLGDSGAVAKPDSATESKKLTEAGLHGEWQSKVDGVFEQWTLQLDPDGKFKLEHRDFALGWTTAVSGKWTLTNGRLLLQAQNRLQDGKPVAVGEKKREDLIAEFRGGEWALIKAGGPELRKVKKGK